MRESTNTTRERYRYNDINERYIRTNRFAMLGIQVLYVLCLIYFLMKLSMHSVDVKLAVFCIIVMFIFTVITDVLFFRQKDSRVFKYLISIQLVIVFEMFGFLTQADFILSGYVAVLAVCVLYYEPKFVHKIAVLYGIAYFITWAIRIRTGIIEQNVNSLYNLLIYIMALYVVARVGDIMNVFYQDSLGMVEHQQRKQQKIMDAVLTISKTVQENVEEGVDAIARLSDSSNLVRQSMSDISDATNETALNVNEQTEMTQDIQQAIEKAVSYSEEMVQVAGESEKNIAQSFAVIENLKGQSESISRTNDQVRTAMEKLQDKTKEVQNIAQIIFDISSQTNLLALNASIESARAGEAGRGFAVVADQIRQLAEQTRQSTESISRLLEELNNDAKEAVESIKVSVEAAEEQDGIIKDTSERFEKLGKNIKVMIDNTNTIADRIRYLSDANAKLVDNISRLSATTEEITSNAEQTSETSDSNYANAQKVNDKLNFIRENTDQLSKYMDD